MSMKEGIKAGLGETRLAEAEVDGTTEVYAPRKMTFAENVILTIKVLAGFGLLGAALWGISLWKTLR
jgi:hypothetical protein